MSVTRSKSNVSRIASTRPSILKADVYELVENTLFVISTLLVFCFNYDNVGIGNRLTNAMVGSLIFFEILLCLSRHKIIINFTLYLYIAFLLFCLLSVLWSASFDRSFNRVMSLFLMLFYYIALINYSLVRINEQNRFILYVRLLVFCALFASVYLLIKTSSGWRSGTRINGVIGDANQASAYLAYSIPVSLYCGERRFLPQWFVAADIVFVAIAIGIMGSRSGITVVMIGILLYWFIRLLQRGVFSSRTIFGVILILIFTYAMVQLIMNNEIAYKIIGSRFESFIDIISGRRSKVNENSYYQRQALYALAVDLFRQHPIIGVGIDAYGWYASRVIRNTFSHNDYLQLLSCVGFVGFSLYYTQHVYIASKFRMLKDREAALGISLLAQMLAFHMTVVFYYQKLEFVFISFLVALVETRCNRCCVME